MSYTKKVLDLAMSMNPNESEFHQALKEILPTLQPIIDQNPQIEKDGILERLIEPERYIMFRVPWIDDNGNVHVNRGYRVQYNSALGPYKGGIRFHPSVNSSIIKFLGFEQIFKNALTGLPMGGGKGGANFDPKGKSDREIMSFCQSFMTALYTHIGANTDVPAGDIGVGAREIGFMYGQYRRLVRLNDGTMTGKAVTYGGSLTRTEATGYGLVYMVEKMLEQIGEGLKGKNVVVSGSGNVAIYAVEKAIHEGAKVLTMSDSNGYIYDKDGIDLDAIKQIKLVQRGRISEYVKQHPHAKYHDKGLVWDVPCDVALPCATQNELPTEGAEQLVKNKCIVVAEGANMPTTLEATYYLQKHGILFMPGKASNAGGVAVSGLEMAQNSMRISWSFEEVEAKLRNIMHDIYAKVSNAAAQYGDKDNMVFGANIAGFVRVVNAMLAQGVI